MVLTRNRLCAAVVAVVWSAACGGGAPPAAAGDEGTPRGVSAASATPRKNACALVDRAALEAIAGRKLDMLHDIQADDLSACELRDAASNTVLVTVTVHWAGGRELARTNQAAMSMARQMLNDDDVDIEEITGSAKVRGLADKAYYSDLMPSWVLKQDVLIEVISPTFPHAQTKAVFISVSKSALSRL